MTANIKLVEISENNKPPKGCNRKQAKELGAIKIREKDIDELIMEIRSRDHFDEEFDINSNETMTYINEIEETD